MNDEQQDRRHGRAIVLYRVVAVAMFLSAVSNATSGNTRAVAGFLAAAWFAVVVAWVMADLRESERAQRASYAALVEACAALQEARAEIVVAHNNIPSVTEEEMRAYFGLPQKEQR